MKVLKTVMAHKTVLVPSYLKKFSCIGGDCEDSCCIGWQIPIDEKTYKKYKKVKEPVMKRRLDKEVVVRRSGQTIDHVAKIKLKNNRCAFLSKGGWCDIYNSLGEGYLSQTCTLYPRTINQIGSHLECSLTFSCPEALRCMLLGEDPITFEEIPLPDYFNTISGHLTISEGRPRKWEDYILVIRKAMIEILQWRNYDFEKRMALLGRFMKDLDKVVKRQNLKEIPTLIETYRNYLSSDQLTLEGVDLRCMSKEGMNLIKGIEELSKEHKLKSDRYKKVLECVLQGLANDEERYIKGYTAYYQQFLDKYAYMLEHYFVNYIIERGVPVDGNSPSESFEKLRAYEKLIRAHLIGSGLNEGEITPKQFILCVQSLAKTFDHNEVYYSLLQEKCSNF